MTIMASTNIIRLGPAGFWGKEADVSTVNAGVRS